VRRTPARDRSARGELTASLFVAGGCVGMRRILGRRRLLRAVRSRAGRATRARGRTRGAQRAGDRRRSSATSRAREKQCPIKIARSAFPIPRTLTSADTLRDRAHATDPVPRQKQCPIKLEAAPAAEIIVVTQPIGRRAETVPNQDGTGRTAAAFTSKSARLGWPPRGRRTEIRVAPPRAAARHAPRAHASVPRARHDTRQARSPVAAVPANIRSAVRGACRREPRRLSYDPLLGPDGPPSSHRRSGLARCSDPWLTGPRRSNRPCAESLSAPFGQGLECSLSRARSQVSTRGSKRHRLRPSELSEAPASGDRLRSAQLRASVRGMVVGAAGERRAVPGRTTADLARISGLATGGRLDRSTGRPGRESPGAVACAGPTGPRPVRCCSTR
jgi:hypothetical protein